MPEGIRFLRSRCRRPTWARTASHRPDHTRIDRVSFDDVWKDKVAGQLGNPPVWFISAADYVKNKRAAGRTKDLADAEEIENLMGPVSG